MTGAPKVDSDSNAGSPSSAGLLATGEAVPTFHPLPPLPYPQNALEPAISADTVETHYGKHHRGYVERLNRLIPGTPYALMPLEGIVLAAKYRADEIFNNAAQAWNHTFYWRSLRPPDPKSAIPVYLSALIQASFGGLPELKRELAAAATAHFGAGWAWLVLAGSRLRVTTTGNADTPLMSGLKPLLVIDVWEHAYYLDYRNRRADYVNSVVEHLLNWQFAADSLAST
jgi:Fe-Mn family superoxide dismutase